MSFVENLSVVSLVTLVSSERRNVYDMIVTHLFMLFIKFCIIFGNFFMVFVKLVKHGLDCGLKDRFG